jgi:hypothetical protein
MEESDNNSDCLVTFMQTEGPAPSFHWLLKNDICWVEMDSILKIIQPLIAGIGCRLILHEKI